MIRLSILSVLFGLLALRPALAEAFQRPSPVSQSATVELWFALAALALGLSLAVVQWLVSRR